MPASHEEFVTNINGSSKAEVLMQQLVMPALILVYGALAPLLHINFCTKRQFWLAFVVENLAFAIPYQLAVTVFADYLGLILTSCVVLSVTLLLAVIRPKQEHVLATKTVEARSLFTTWTRSWLYLATAVCILAVDFPLFPRRSAKCENFGVSLMDTGVGWYVVMHALSLSNATAKDEVSVVRRSNGDEKASDSSKQKSSRLKWMKQTFSLLLLGLVRLIAVKSVDYPEHVNEYGVHFNFFFTLFFLKLFSTLIKLVPGRLFNIALFAAGGASLFVAEWLLQTTDSRVYLFHATRETLLSANREGLFSLLGYSATFCFATLFTRILLVPYWKSYSTWDGRAKSRLLAKLLLTSVLFYAALRSCEICLDPVSRRFANASFVFWTLALSVFILAMFLLAEILLVKSQPGWPVLLEAVSRFGLLHFLAANILTGLVNMTIRSHELDDAYVSSLILAAYTIGTNLVAAVAYRRSTGVSEGR